MKNNKLKQFTIAFIVAFTCMSVMMMIFHFELSISQKIIHASGVALFISLMRVFVYKKEVI